MATAAAPPATYALPQEFLDFRETIRKMVTERVAPRAAEIDANAEYPRDLASCSPNTICSGSRSRPSTAARAPGR